MSTVMTSVDKCAIVSQHKEGQRPQLTAQFTAGHTTVPQDTSIFVPYFS